MSSAEKPIVKLERKTDPAALLGDEIAGDPQFLHAVLCQLGLPRSAPEGRIFTRSSGSSSLLIEAGRWHNGHEWEEMPLPSGTRPRLVLFHICSEAVRTRSAEVEVEDSAKAFLRKLGIATGGRDMANFKRQMLALAACRMQLAYRTDVKVTNVKCDPIKSFEAWLQDNDGQHAMWPGTVTLSQEFFDTLIEHAVPLDPRAISELQNSALALDAYTWLAHRLCRIRKSAGTTLYWRNLKEQFGQEYNSPKDFQREFIRALRKAKDVYPEARIEEISGGITLLPSPPPVKRGRVVVALPKPSQSPSIVRAEKPAEKSIFAPVVSAEALKQAKQIVGDWDIDVLHGDFAKMIEGKKVGNPDERFIQWVRAGYSRGHAKTDAVVPNGVKLSETALDEARQIAPSWNVDELVSRYTAWVAKQETAPTYPDKAFLGWVRKVARPRREDNAIRT
jgi:hypothetical protein